jgi:3-phenylpropionate/trans-cinnamate dioxygenase ferredoxin subunit
MTAEESEEDMSNGTVEDWIEVCDVNEMELEDVRRFDYRGSTYAIYRSPSGRYFATDGLCTHERVHLAGGLVINNVVECPKHNGRFDYQTGRAMSAPVCVDLRTHEVKVMGAKVMIKVESQRIV